MPLCTKDEVKNYIGMSGSDATIDTLISDLCNRVSTTIETYCNRTFDSTTHTEYYDGHGTDTLYTNNYPITSVSGIWEDSGREWEDSSVVDSDEYFTTDTTIYRKLSTFIDYPVAIKLTYTSGYTTLPADLKQAAITEVARLYEKRKEVSVTDKTYGDATTSYSMDVFLPNSLLVFDMYRRKYVI